LLPPATTTDTVNNCTLSTAIDFENARSYTSGMRNRSAAIVKFPTHPTKCRSSMAMYRVKGRGVEGFTNNLNCSEIQSSEKLV